MFCPKCGSQNLDTNKFCKKCGKQLPNRGQTGQGVSQSFSQPLSLLGQVLDGKYRIEAKLGSGGMGDVYRATRTLIGDSVAIKILHPHLAHDPQAAERFRREAVMATKLRHRNVVGIYDVGISAAHNVPYILMELAEGYTLRQIINQYRVLPLDFAVTVTTQVCSALDEAHALGIVHRDIKPENIVANQTTTGWYVKVLDFGIAKLYNQGDIGLTLDGSAMGTPQYMSPEQCLGETLDARSDIYSVGILLYELLSGTVPFKSPTPSAIAIHQVQTAPAPPRSLNAEIHPDVESVILKSLEKQRELRQQKASLLAQDLIKAATVAFKTGFAVPAAPIPAPDAAPEFEADPAETAPSSTASGITGPSGNFAADVESENDNTAKSSSEKENGGHVNSAFSSVESAGTAIAAESQSGRNLQVNENELMAPIEPDVPVTPEMQPETLASGAISDSEASIENFGSDEDLSLVFEEAELRLDELLADMQIHASASPSLDKSEKEKTDGDQPGVITNQSRPIEESPDLVEPAFADSNDAPLFGEIGPIRDTRKYIIYTASALLLLFVFLAVGLGTWFLSGSTPAEPAANTSPKETGPPLPPAGMAYVPGGEFMMGSDTGDEYSRPAHRVSVKPFFIDLTEVTNEEYKKYVDASGRKPPPDWKNAAVPAGKAKFPVTGVTWDDANAFAAWADKRLPTEQEWEFAARGTDGRIYPWGHEWKPENANADKQTKGMREVGQGGKSPFGLFDMSGNAWEWTASDAAAYPKGKELPKRPLELKIIRGGSWNRPRDEASTIFRSRWGATGQKEYDYTSFRCVKDIPAPSQ